MVKGGIDKAVYDAVKEVIEKCTLDYPRQFAESLMDLTEDNESFRNDCAYLAGLLADSGTGVSANAKLALINFANSRVYGKTYIDYKKEDKAVKEAQKNKKSRHGRG